MKRPTSSKFIEALAFAQGVRPSTVRYLLNDVATELVAAVLERGESVRVPGLGTFHPRTRKARRIRHIGAAELTTLPAWESVGFRAANKAKRVAR